MSGTPIPASTPSKPYSTEASPSPSSSSSQYESSPLRERLYGETAAVGPQLCATFISSFSSSSPADSETESEGGATLQTHVPTFNGDTYSDLDNGSDITMEDLDDDELYNLARAEPEDVTTAEAYPFLSEDDDNDDDNDNDDDDAQIETDCIDENLSPQETLSRLMDPARPVVPISGLFRCPPHPRPRLSSYSSIAEPPSANRPVSPDDDGILLTGRDRRAMSSLSHANFSTVQGRLALSELKWHLELPADLSPGDVLHGLLTQWIKVRRAFGTYHPRLAADLNQLDWTGVAETAETHEAHLSCTVWTLAFSGYESLFSPQAQRLIHIADGEKTHKTKEDESDGARRVRASAPRKSPLSQIWTSVASE